MVYRVACVRTSHGWHLDFDMAFETSCTMFGTTYITIDICAVIA